MVTMGRCEVGNRSQKVPCQSEMKSVVHAEQF